MGLSTALARIVASAPKPGLYSAPAGKFVSIGSRKSFPPGFACRTDPMAGETTVGDRCSVPQGICTVRAALPGGSIAPY